MSLITDKQIRRHISEVLKTYLRKPPYESEHKVILKDLDSMGNLLREGRRDAKRDANKAYQRELSISYLSIVTLAISYLAIDQEDDSNPPIKRDWIAGPDPNWIIANLLLQVTNYSLAVVRLVEDGLDNAARCVLRALSELCAQMLVLASDKDQLLAYAKAVTPNEAKQAWYELFAKKGRLSKNLEKLETRFGLPNWLANDLKSFREDLNLTHSQAVHHSFISTVILAYSGDFENEERLHSALLGKATTASRQTLDSLNILLFYTVLMLVNVLVKVHGFKAPLDNRAWVSFFTLAECVKEVGAADDAR